MNEMLNINIDGLSMILRKFSVFGYFGTGWF